MMPKQIVSIKSNKHFKMIGGSGIMFVFITSYIM